MSAKSRSASLSGRNLEGKWEEAAIIILRKHVQDGGKGNVYQCRNGF